MKRFIVIGIVLALGLSLVAAGCDDDDTNGGNGPTSTPEETEAPAETPVGGTPTEPGEAELPSDVIDAVEDYIVEGNIPAFPPVDSIKEASNCTAAGEVCYDPEASSFEGTTASVRVYPYASDEIQDVTLEQVDGEWNVTGASSATE